ncbi:hypothetical protein PYW08_013716 [Mythimna loreyi]|uniref:Uncharacterized protein n=1 Tax=Mythimna loreyi TaxID=667449 RepID=A0ACC2R7J0_9NEOP|nr:hypothetical protein PYW08_013716 [Mythimna loreyi]
MHILFHWMFVVIICKTKCQQMLNEELTIVEKPGENINIKQTNIERRFIEDLDDEEWHVAHLRGALMDGRRDCKTETFADKARRYRKMLKEDGGRVQYVSSKPLVVKPEDIVIDSCKAHDDMEDRFANVTMKVTSANFNFTGAQNATVAVNATTATMADTTAKLDFKATTVQSKVDPNKLKKEDEAKNDTRRGEYMFSSVEYYDESIEFDSELCPDAVEIIGLEIDQLRSYDLECEMTVEWRSLE